jgi:hypothetical protein
MESTLYWLGMGFGTLVGVALFVACWEHWRGQREPFEPTVLAPRRAAIIDLDLDNLPPAGGQRAQQATLGAALGSMVRGPNEPVSPSIQSWIETRPMVGAGVERERRETQSA